MEEGFQRISVLEAKQLLEADSTVRLVDVREPHEFEFCHLNDSLLCPLSQFAETIEMAGLRPDEKIVLYCHHGVRSAKAAGFLAVQGYQNLYSIEGGIDAWSQEIDSGIPQY
jgi:rhodanese-related sulfurtransferase